MKKLIIIAAGLITMHSCTKGGGTTTPATPGTTLNATENSLKGKWFLIKEEYDGYLNDTTYTTTSTSVYMDLLTDSYSGGASGVPVNYKKFTDARLGIMGVPANGIGYWFFDEAANRLTITGIQWEITNKTSSSLVLKKTDINMTVTQTFKK